ncbi:MAG: winged helix-turn-helix domain-containing protein [Thermofilaceae archaeon]
MARVVNARVVNESSGPGVFADPSALQRLGNRRGDVRRVAILRALLSSHVPLSTREVSRRTGIPERSARYYLRQLVDAGLVERIGRQPVAVYAATRAGAVAYHMLSWRAGKRSRSGRVFLNGGNPSLNGKNRASSRVGALRGDGVICNGNGVCGSVYAVRASLEYQPMGGWWGEVGLRARWSAFWRVLASLGVRLPKRRLKRVMFYVRGGVVHFDGVVAASQEEAELFGLWLLKERVVALVLLCFSLMKWMGFGKRFVDALWSAAPALAVR